MFLAPPTGEGPDGLPQGPSVTEDFQKAMALVTAELKRFVDPSNLPKELVNEMYKLNLAADSLNKNFLLSRTRIVEMGRAVADVAPDIVAMGGKFTDAADTISRIASGSRRNVVAATKDVKDLFAVGQLVGVQVENIVDNFAKVGVEYGDIAKQVGESISMVQNMGLNARTVMKMVVENTEQLQRFNFENGAKGLAKMAAQASMLRFDMSQTFNLAERVLDPEKAIQVASAFQRLGVSAGNLVDPFQLMNQSINDPSGLQDSLINISKQFTYFDEKSKSYKISPQGILTLKEIEDQTQVSAKALRDAAISAADFDKRLAAVSSRQLFPEATEDDKKLLANMARMGEGGEYEISIGGEYKKISELNSTELKKIVDEQKKGPKTVEEIQKSQLNIQESLLANAREINQKLSRNLIATDKNLENTINMAEILRKAGREGAGTSFGAGYKRELDQLREDRKKATTDAERQKIDQQIRELTKEEFRKAKSVISDQMGGGFDEKEYDAEVAKVLTKPISDIFDLLGKDIAKGRGTTNRTSTAATQPTSPSRMVNPNWVRGKGTNVVNAASGTGGIGGTGGGTPQVDVRFPNPPKIIVEKGSGWKEGELIDLIDKGGIQLGESILKLIEDAVKRSGGESRIPGK